MSARVGIAGTFDLLNFGDLLFPLLARRELSQRLPDLELIPYSYLQKHASSWPYDVRPLSSLSEDIETLDLVLVGGGDIVRFDKHVAPGYGPPETDLHHPTAYWLMPTLLAASQGVRVAWNAVGVVPETPAWAHDMLRQGLDAADYVAVRDRISAQELRRVGGRRPVSIVPDTAYGIRRLLPSEGPSLNCEAFLSVHDVTAPYIVVQAATAFAEEASTLRRLLDGYDVIEVPVSTALGDRYGALGIEGSISGEGLLDNPLLLAEVVAGADAVVSHSLHLSIVALSTGVPLNRFDRRTEPKHRDLAELPGVRILGPRDELLSGRGAPSPAMVQYRAQLSAHWDRVAALVGRRTRRGATVTARLSSAYAELSTTTADSYEALVGASHREAAAQRELTSWQQHTANLENELATALEHLNTLRVHASRLSADRDAYAVQAGRVEEARDTERAQTLKHIDALTQALEETQADAARWREQSANYEAHVQRLHAQHSAAEAHAARLSTQLETVTLLAKSFEGLLRGSEAATEDARREVESLQVALAGLGSRLEAAERNEAAVQEELAVRRSEERRRQAHPVSRAAYYVATMGLRPALLRSLQPWQWLRRPPR